MIHPHKFAQAWQRDRDQFGIHQDLGGDARLRGVVTHDRTNKDVGIPVTFILPPPSPAQSPR